MFHKWLEFPIGKANIAIILKGMMSECHMLPFFPSFFVSGWGVEGGGGGRSTS